VAEEIGGVESGGGGEQRSRERRRGDRRDFEFWDESEMTRCVLLFICSKISAVRNTAYSFRIQTETVLV
jgi:hypothetical protein